MRTWQSCCHVNICTFVAGEDPEINIFNRLHNKSW